MRFEFATAGRILFGPGAARDIPALGRRALLVTGRTPRHVPAHDHVRFTVTGEPTLETARDGVANAREHGCDYVIAIGGGSALDAGKAIAALLTNPGDVLDYIEVIGRAQPLPHAPAPFVAVPTTAGTGSEVTRNAVLGSPEHGVKASLRSPLMLPAVAVVDPELTMGLPAAITASTGLDALTQLIEPYVSSRATPLTDALCLDGIRLVAGSLERACSEPADLDARTSMSLAALYGGLALANAGLGAVHGFAAPIGGLFPAPHGAVCAALLPHVVAANVAAIRARSLPLDRYSEVARILTGHTDPDAASDWLAALTRRLDIPPLARWGVTPEDIPAIVDRATQASSMKANPVPLSAEELVAILHAAL